MEDKMKAMKLISESIKRVAELWENVEALADSYGIVLPGSTVSIEELTSMVSRKTKASPFCVEEILRTAFGIIRDLDLTVEDEDEEDDDDE